MVGNAASWSLFVGTRDDCGACKQFKAIGHYKDLVQRCKRQNVNLVELGTSNEWGRAAGSPRVPPSVDFVVNSWAPIFIMFSETRGLRVYGGANDGAAWNWTGKSAISADAIMSWVRDTIEGIDAVPALSTGLVKRKEAKRSIYGDATEPDDELI